MLNGQQEENQILNQDWLHLAPRREDCNHQTKIQVPQATVDQRGVDDCMQLSADTSPFGVWETYWGRDVGHARAGLPAGRLKPYRAHQECPQAAIC